MALVRLFAHTAVAAVSFMIGQGAVYWRQARRLYRVDVMQQRKVLDNYNKDLRQLLISDTLPGLLVMPPSWFYKVFCTRPCSLQYLWLGNVPLSALDIQYNERKALDRLGTVLMQTLDTQLLQNEAHDILMARPYTIHRRWLPMYMTCALGPTWLYKRDMDDAFHTRIVD